MTTVNYPSPVQVNGYSCKNCTDVDYAKKHIDPEHPADGPYGVNAKDRPASLTSFDKPAGANGPAVTFGGVLAGLSSSDKAPAQRSATQGLRLDVTA
jgi:hypothetical protein